MWVTMLKVTLLYIYMYIYCRSYVHSTNPISKTKVQCSYSERLTWLTLALGQTWIILPILQISPGGGEAKGVMVSIVGAGRGVCFCFLIALISALDKTHCAHIAWDSSFFIGGVAYWEYCLIVMWLVSSETAAVSAHVQCTPYNHAPIYSITWSEATYVGCMRV